MSRRKPFHKKHPNRSGHTASAGAVGGSFWIYGHHPVTAALGNPKRRVRRLLATSHVAAELSPSTLPATPPFERIEGVDLSALLPPGAVHQGLAALVDPLPMLDQVTDPQNVGAILRSASAFGAVGLVLTERHAAPESGVLAKAASGGVTF